MIFSKNVILSNDLETIQMTIVRKRAKEREGITCVSHINFGPLKKLTSRRRWRRRQQQYDKRIDNGVDTYVLLKYRCSMINGVQIVN